MRSESVCLLNEGVQVRPERFGLLFYDYRGPRLYFLPTKDLIKDHFFNGKHTVSNLIEYICAKHREWPRLMVKKWLNHALDMLEGKGLIYEQSVC